MIQVSKLSKFFNRKSVKYGLPFFILMIGGSFGLREFTNLRYQFKQVTPIKSKDLEKLGIDMKKPGEVTLETEFEKVKKIDIDEWEQVRGPRPWEENSTN